MSPSEIRHVNAWIVTAAVMQATFMEILDTGGQRLGAAHGGQSRRHRRRGHVGRDLLSRFYAIILTTSGWLANRIGRRNMLLACVTGFTFTSGSCGMATSLDWLIFFRVLQGLTGGGLQPLAQAVLLETFPPLQHGTAMAAFGLGII
ncbi:MAG TPA: MFS transporter, partial [Terriglobales bacterium]